MTGWATEPRPAAACLICGDAGELRMGLMRYGGTEPYAYGWRCTDHRACRDRCERNGDRWPLEDRP